MQYVEIRRTSSRLITAFYGQDDIAANLGIETDDFDYAPFFQQGALGKVHQLFGTELITIINELNEALAA